MGNLAELIFIDGSWDTGFSLFLRIGGDRGVEVRGYLPANDQIPRARREWRHLFALLLPSQRSRTETGDGDWEIDRDLPSHVPERERQILDLCRHAWEQLQDSVNQWLSFQDPDWQLTVSLLVAQFARDPNGRLLIRSPSPDLWQLPWYAWEVLATYPDVGLSFSRTNFQPVVAPRREGPLLRLPEIGRRWWRSLVASDRVRILALFGTDSWSGSTPLDLDRDAEQIVGLRRTHLYRCDRPTERDAIEALSRFAPEIFFFAGHSQGGYVFLNDREQLSVEKFRSILREAVLEDLKIALFNSCHGWELALELLAVDLPFTIAMQEVVPDPVAHRFLREFLQRYSGGTSLPIAVRRASEQLQALTDLPGAEGLPILVQSPPAIPPRYRDLARRWSVARLSAALSIAIAALVISARLLGLLQGWELLAYDRFLQQRPIVESDKRILVVDVSESELGSDTPPVPIPDARLAAALTILEEYRPRAIALDIYRDVPQGAGWQPLRDRVRHLLANESVSFIAACQYRPEGLDSPTHGEATFPGILAPDSEHLGFSDAVLDPDGVIRRHLLQMEANPVSQCQPEYALSFATALRYLHAEGIEPQTSSRGFLQLGQTEFERLQTPAGGYQQIDDLGYQILLNYRAYEDRTDIAPAIPVRDLLAGKLLSRDVEDKIVLIGYVDSDDIHNTPYSSIWEAKLPESAARQAKLPGVYVNAQMVSQIVSAAKGERALMHWLPAWIDGVCIAIAAGFGGAIAVWIYEGVRRTLSPKLTYLWLTITASLFATSPAYAVCVWAFQRGYWYPFVPIVTAFFAAIFLSGCLCVYHLSGVRSR